MIKDMIFIVSALLVSEEATNMTVSIYKWQAYCILLARTNIHSMQYLLLLQVANQLFL